MFVFKINSVKFYYSTIQNSEIWMSQLSMLILKLIWDITTSKKDVVEKTEEAIVCPF